MDINEIESDMLRFTGGHMLFEQFLDSKRKECAAKQEPHYEVWLSRANGLPRYLWEDRFIASEKRGVFKITDLKTSETYERKYVQE